MAKETVNYSDLVQRATERDADACEQLYSETSLRMLGLARSMLKNEEDALDILQESYLYAFRSLEQLKNPESFGAWLHQIVTNRCRNFLARTRPKLFAGSLTGEEGDDMEVEDEDITFRPDESADYSQVRQLVLEMVEALPDDQRICVLLFYYQEMKVQQIAQLLEVSENTVKSRLNYARKKIRAQAEELERKGTILHGVAPIPLLVLLFRQGVEQTHSAAAASQWGAIAAESAFSTAGGIASVTASETASAGSRGGIWAFLETMGGKAVVAAVVAVVCISAGVVIGRMWNPHTPAPLEEQTNIVEGVAPEQEPVSASEPEPASEPEQELESEPEADSEPEPSSEPEPDSILEPEPEHEPEPQPQVQSATADSPDFIFYQTFPNQRAVDVELPGEVYMGVELSSPAVVSAYDRESGSIIMTIRQGETFYVRYSAQTYSDIAMGGGPGNIDGGGSLFTTENLGWDGAGTLYRVTADRKGTERYFYNWMCMDNTGVAVIINITVE